MPSPRQKEKPAFFGNDSFLWVHIDLAPAGGRVGFLRHRFVLAAARPRHLFPFGPLGEMEVLENHGLLDLIATKADERHNDDPARGTIDFTPALGS